MGDKTHGHVTLVANSILYGTCCSYKRTNMDNLTGGWGALEINKKKTNYVPTTFIIN